MVVTRSGADALELEERRLETERARREEQKRVEDERIRRLSLEPPASPTVPEAGPSKPQYPGDPPRPTSPRRSVRSYRSSTSVAARQRAAEIDFEEKIMALKMRELQLETELLRKKHAIEMSAIQGEEQEESVHEVANADHQKKVDDWFRANPVTSKGERDRKMKIVDERGPRLHPRGRSPTPTRSRSHMDALAEVMDRLSRPKIRCSELPTFSGHPTEWLIFKASYLESTKIYNISPVENLQRLRSCLKGEAREAVAPLLYAATSPDAVIKTLEQSYGRPEDIIDRAFDEIKKLSRPGPSATDLNKFAIKVQNVVCALKSIGCEGFLHNPLLTRDVLEKLSPHIRARWCDYALKHERTAEPQIVMLSRFLMQEADGALRFNYTSATNTGTISASARKEVRSTNTAGNFKKKPNVIYNVVEEEQRDPCPSCEKDHKLPECPKYKALPVEQRWKLVREKKMCFRCVVKKHQRFYCKAKPCGVNECRRPHHATLHQDERPKKVSDNPKSSFSSTETVLSVATLTATDSKVVLLKMCPVTVVGPRGEIDTHALLDEGATISLIDEDLAQSIGAKGVKLPLNMQSVNTSHQERDSQLITVHLRSTGDTLLRLRARTIKNMKLVQQSIPKSLLEQDHLRDLPQNEVCYHPTQPGILVGADHWEYIVSQELRTGKPNQPAASRTQLGWVIHGTIPRGVIRDQDSVLHIYAPEHSEDTIEQQNQRLHDLVEEHFRIDALGVAHEPRTSDTDLRATKIVEQTLKKIDKGYEVGLPWKQDDLTLPPSYNAALRRLHKTEQKMDTDPVFAKEYSRQVENLLEKRYAEPCDGTETTSAICWYLPHFAVQNPNKPGKQRLVFDAAAKSYGVSLNDQLLEGPDLLMSLQGILFRFREKKVAVTADIQEMFLQIKIRSKDQPAQQFLWRGENRTKPPQRYKMTSMIFGAASSPFMAHFVRNHNAKVHALTHPLAFDAITRSHYMDDLVASYEDEQEAYRAITETKDVHAVAGFMLRGWSSSDRTVLRDVPSELHATKSTQLGGSEQENKILGLYWNAERDELGFNTSMNRVPVEVRTRMRAPTKREALSAVMSIYDPLGLLSQYTIRAKIILQSLWRLKMSWDEPIPTEENSLFATWLERLTDLASLRLKRCYALEGCQDLELHVLCDASEQAYAAVAYWRITQPDGKVCLSLIAAKAKVAPKRTQTIPRLELQAAVIGARLADAIKKEHRVEVKRTVYWTDSTTVVHWIRHDTRRYTPFVSHRLGEIAELTHKEEWRWLPTGENVADDATRFANTPILGEDRWFRGPDFLHYMREHWPPEEDANEDEEEVFHVYENQQNEEWLPEPSRFSKYETLVRTSARVLAFIDICRRKTKHLELRHLEEAERALIRRAQRDSFGDELERLKTSRPITKGSRLFRLDPILEDGILRVKGRIGAATAPLETKRPVILDGRHHITRLIVMKEHCAAGHANRERVTNDLRQRFWVIHLRPTVRSIEKDCALCKVRRTRPQIPVTGDLPRARLEPFQRPFTHCGADYFGPMIVKVGRRREKRWGALFTCLTSRAVHLEIVPSLSTSSAIMALRRMAARRGWPRIMYSDNATNFRGADRELQEAHKEWEPALKEEGLSHRLEWRYIPPGAPNQGGAWERLVRSVKVALTATLKEREPTEEVLYTLLTEVEFSVNARPLTHVSVDPNDPEALTPNHFLLGSSTGMPLTGPCEEMDRRTWRACQALADNFWRRWVREYLPTLVPRGESRNTRKPLCVGDIVTIVDHTLPRNVWPMGVVERIFTGPDGGVRVADIRTKTGIFKRPVSRLVVLVQEGAARATPGGGLLRTPA